MSKNTSKISIILHLRMISYLLKTNTAMIVEKTLTFSVETLNLNKLPNNKLISSKSTDMIAARIIIFSLINKK